MRNLKKILAVICVVAMLASVAIVPALAATSYDTQAATLNSLGLMTNAGLDQPSNRLQGLIFAIDAAGKGKDALAMTDAEVAAALANVVDAKDIPAWGQKFAAYAVKNGYTTGVGGVALPQIKFAPLAPIHATEYLVWLLKIGMGYTNGTSNILDTAVANNIITIGQVTKFGADTYTLVRDDIAGMLFTAVSTGKTADGKKFIDQLVANGAVTEAAAVAAGLYTVVPSTVSVVSATATNLKEIVVVFNTEVTAATAEDEANYVVGGDDNLACTATLGADKKTVTLEMDAALDNQTDYTVKVSGIKGVNGTTITEVTKTVAVLDSTMPSVTGVKTVGDKLIKVTFSEPVTEDSATVNANYKIDDEIVTGSLTMDGSKTVNIILDDSLDAGDHTLKVSDIVDFFGYKLAANSNKFTVVADTAKPTATVKSASQTELVVTFSEEIDSYGDITCDDASAASNELDSDLKTLTIKYNRDDALPVEGTKVSIADVTDFSGNSADITLSVKPTADETRPTFVGYKLEDQQTLVLEFSEDMFIDNIGDANDFFVLKDKDGNVVDFDAAVAYDTNDDGDDVLTKIVLTTPANLDTGAYTLLIKDVEDNSPLGNKILSKTVTVNVADKVAPTVSAVYSNGDDKLFVQFDEAVDKATAEDEGNYTATVGIVTKQLSKDNSVTATLLGDKKTVQLAWDTDKDGSWLFGDGDNEMNAVNVDDIDNLQIEDVKDVAGNVMLDDSVAAAFDVIQTPAIATAEITGAHTIKLTIEDTGAAAQLLGSSVAISDFSVYCDTDDSGDITAADDNKLTITKASYDYNSDDDIATVTLTVSQTFNADGTYTAEAADHDVLVMTKAEPKSKNVLGTALAEVTAAAPVVASDDYAPAIDSIDDVNDGDTVVTLNMTEDMAVVADGKGDNEFVVKVNGVNVTADAAIALAGDDTIVITLGDPVASGDKIIVTFDPIDSADTTITDANGVALAGFTKTITVKN